MSTPALHVTDILKGEKCVAFMQKWSKARYNSELRGLVQLAQYDDAAKIRHTFLVKVMPGGYSFLVWRETGEEVILDVCGLLAACTLLPPRTSNHHRETGGSRQYLHSVGVVGPECAEFKKALSALQKIFSYFEETFPEGDMRPLKPYAFTELDGIQAETRYLTPVKNNVFQEIPLTDDNDATGVLREMTASGKLTFTDDNEISFVEITEDAAGELSKSVTNPGIFRQGQLVEASLSFRTISAGKKHSFLTRLSSLLLVNRIGSQLIKDHHATLRVPDNVESKIIVPKRRHIVDDLVHKDMSTVKRPRVDDDSSSSNAMETS